MTIMSTNQAVSKGNFITSAHLHFMLLNLCYCSPKQHMLPAWILTILPLSETISFPTHVGQRVRVREAAIARNLILDTWGRGSLKKPLCAFTLTPLAHMAWLKRAMLTQVMVPSGSVGLRLHSLQMFSEVPLLPTSSGSIKAKGTVENALRPEKQLYLTCLKGLLATLWFFSKHLLAWSHDYWARIIN